MRYYFLVILFLFIYCKAEAQEFTNKGRDFWLCYPAHINGNQSRMALYISATTNANGTVTYPGGSITFSVAANQATTLQIYPSLTPNVINAQDEGISNIPKAIHVTSDMPIVLYAHVLQANRSGSSLIVPTHTLGRDYMVASYKSSVTTSTPSGVANTSPPGSQFQIVAIEDGTTVEITPTAPSLIGGRIPGLTFSISLNKGDVYQYRTAYTEDITGTRIRSVSTSGQSCKRIAVFSGSSYTTMDCGGAGGGDNLFQQMLPIKSWGKNYLTAPTADVEYNIYRVLVDDPTTQVTVNGNILPTTQLIKNTYYEIRSSIPNTANVINSDRPVLVLQYLVSQSCDSRNASSTQAYPSDPEMIILNPVEQTINDVTVVSARRDLTPPNTSITKHFISIIMKTNAISSLRIDGAPPLGNFIAIGSSGYSYLNENVTNSTNNNPTHRIVADSGFIALAYGLGNFESYGYNAGTSLRDLFRFISVKNEYARVDFPATCRNTNFRLSVVLPYEPDSIRWKFNGLFTDVTLSNPSYDSSWIVENKTLYRYTLPATYSVSYPPGYFLINIEAFSPSSDGCGGMEELSYSLEVMERPLSSFDIGPNRCLSDSILFKSTATLSPPRSFIHNYWSTGDGNSYNDKDSIKHKYAIDGTYNINHYLITDIGCISDTAMHPLTINPPPVALFSTTAPYCVNAPIIFNDLSVSGSAAITQYRWNYGDGIQQTLATNAGHTHRYNTAGAFTATLQIATSDGCLSNPYSLPLNIQANPVTDFAVPSICSRDIASLNGQDQSTGGISISSWNWQYGDGNSGTGMNVTHTYAAGNYVIRLIAQSAAGCADTAMHNITVNGGNLTPNFTINPAGTLCGGPVSFIDASAIDFGSISRLQIQWDAANNPALITADNAPTFGKTYTHTYPAFNSPASRNYTVNYIISSGQSCVDTLTRNITVMATPSVQFGTIPEYCSNAGPFTITQVTELNGMPGTGVFSGNGVTTAGVFSPTVTGAGSHAVTYTYTAANGCSATTTTNITINPTPVANAGNDKALLVGGGSVNLTPVLVTGMPVTYLWSPATFLDNPAIASPRIENITGDITYTLTVTSNKGCADTDDVLIKLLKEVKIPNIFSPNGDGINDTWNIEFLEAYPGSVLSIFNRYGQEIKRYTNYTIPWDGTVNGNKVAVGTYYYVIDFKNGKPPIKGFVDVIR